MKAARGPVFDGPLTPADRTIASCIRTAMLEEYEETGRRVVLVKVAPSLWPEGAREVLVDSVEVIRDESLSPGAIACVTEEP